MNLTFVHSLLQLITCIKHCIIICVAIAWGATYFVVFEPSYIEITLMQMFNLTSTQYSYIISIAYYTAIIGALFTPFLLNYVSALNALIIVQFLSLIGQILFKIPIYFKSNNYIWLLYISRMCIDFSIAGTDALFFMLLTFWFGKSKDINFASGISVSIAQITRPLLIH